jgi:hypothetical protein
MLDDASTYRIWGDYHCNNDPRNIGRQALRQGLGRASPVTDSVCVWFSFLEQVADRMPTKRKEYQLSAKTKSEVFGWYEDDRKLYPTLYLKCHKKTFFRVWTDRYDHLKVRKWTRFSKCAECILLRS